MTTVILFVLGTIIGSFLNVVGLRLNSGLSLGGRSHCSSCRNKLNFWELIPVFSFFLVKGRCRKCRARISWQYPLVELWTGLVFVTVPLSLLPVFGIYILITIYDARHKVIPDSLVYPAIILSLIGALTHLGTYTLIDFLAGPILFLFFISIWFVSRGRAIGFADAKLVLSIGLLLGGALGFSAIIWGFWAGALCGLLLLISRKNITMKSELPFAPFLIFGAWVSVILQIDLLHVTQLF